MAMLFNLLFQYYIFKRSIFYPQSNETQMWTQFETLNLILGGGLLIYPVSTAVLQSNSLAYRAHTVRVIHYSRAKKKDYFWYLVSQPDIYFFRIWSTFMICAFNYFFYESPFSTIALSCFTLCKSQLCQQKQLDHNICMNPLS